MSEIPLWSKHSNADRSISIYRNGKFVAAIENTTASCDLFYQFSKDIEKLTRKLEIYKAACEEIVNAPEVSRDAYESFKIMIRAARQAIQEAEGAG